MESIHNAQTSTSLQLFQFARRPQRDTVYVRCVYVNGARL